MTTPSVEAARAIDVSGEARSRDFDNYRLAAAEADVTHGPLYFEGPDETVFEHSGEFGLGTADSVSWLHQSGRFLLNAALFPVSMLVTPPHGTMTSDGRPSRHVTGIGRQDAEAVVESDVTPDASAE